jgi:flavorubredoxin
MALDMKKLFKEAQRKRAKRKTCPVFGSYGWNGEAPELVLEIMKNKFGMRVIDPPFAVKYAPDTAGLEKYRKPEKRFAERLMHTA